MRRARKPMRRLSTLPYHRTGPADAGRWIDESWLSQVFERQLEDGEVQVVVSEVTATFTDARLKSGRGLAAATDRALHLRVTVRPEVYQALLLPYAQVRDTRPAGDDDGLVITYVDPAQAAREQGCRELHLGQASNPLFVASVPRLIAAARRG
jgi:hypothetical protein